MTDEAYRCISPVCKPLGCSDCNCAVPADVYAALGRAFADAERERCAKLCDDEARLWEDDRNGRPATEARLCAARIRAGGPR